MAVSRNTLRLDPYVVDTLMPDLVGHDHQPSAFLVYLYLWRRAGTGRARRTTASYLQIGVDTGLSRSAVQAAVAALIRRQLVRLERASATALSQYTVLTPWVR
jgi:DNA-binding MarR family transcriptional regulator